MTGEEKKFQLLNRAKASDYMLGQLSPILDKKRAEELSLMKGRYRAGEHDVLGYVASLAKLCAFDDIEESLRRNLIAAEKIMEEKIK